MNHVIGGGRPLLALILHLSFGAFEPIDGLRPLRLLGVVGVAVCGLVALTSLVRSGMDRRLALPTAVAMCFLPTFHGPAAWATAWEMGYAAAIAGAAGLAIVGATSGTGARTRRLLLASAALVVSFLVYQPATMFVWFPIAADLVVGRAAWSAAVRSLARRVIAVAAAILVGAAIAVAVVEVAGIDTLARTGLLTPATIPTKVSWFVTRLVVTGARPFVVSSPTAAEAAATALPVFLIIIGGLNLVSPGTTRARLARVAAGFLVGAASALTNLVVRENQFEFRVLIGLAPIMLMFLVVSVAEIVRRTLGAQLGRAAMTAAVWVMTAVVMVSGWRLVDELYINPSVANERYFRAAAPQLRSRAVRPDRRRRAVVMAEA